MLSIYIKKTDRDKEILGTFIAIATDAIKAPLDFRFDKNCLDGGKVYLDDG